MQAQTVRRWFAEAEEQWARIDTIMHEHRNWPAVGPVGELRIPFRMSGMRPGWSGAVVDQDQGPQKVRKTAENGSL
jgi:hypothetical protein